MEKIYSILEETVPEVEFKGNVRLVTDGYIDSFDIVTIISALEEAFDIDIPVECMVPENFESADTLYALVLSIKDGKA